MNYYHKYIKYKLKYLKLKNNSTNNSTNNSNNNSNNKIGGYKISNFSDNINDKYPVIKKEINIFGYEHSMISGGCIF